MSLEGARRLAEKMVPVEREVSRSKGNVSLFALFRRKDFPIDWDVVIAAPWVDAEKRMDQLKYVDSVLKKHLALDDIVQLSRIVLIPASDENVRWINKTIPVRRTPVEIRNAEFFGMLMRQGWILRSRGGNASSRRREPSGTRRSAPRRP
jgi:hypothetical protein